MTRAVPGSLSVREILAFELLEGARVLGGAAGLDRRVQRLNVMTVPDIVRWTKERELLLTTGYPLPHEPQALIRLFTELDARGVSAVGVKYGSYGPGLMPEALRAADELGLPIIDIPENVAFDDLLGQVLSDLSNRQASALAQAREIHEALLQIFLGGGGLGDIVRELSAALRGAGVICVDGRGQVLAQVAGEEHWARLSREDLLDDEGAPAATRITNPTTDVVCAPVLAGTLRHGHLLAVAGPDGGLPVEAETMVQQSAMVAALEITQRLAVSAVERHFESNAIHELLTSGDGHTGETLSRAASFGWDLDRRLLVVVARRDPGEAPGPPQPWHEHDIGAWVSTVRSVDRRAVAGALGRDLVAVCGADTPADHLGGALADGIHGVMRRRFSIGVSGVVDRPTGLPAGYRHARTAVELAQRTGGPGTVLAYAGLGLIRLLSAVGDPAELRTFVEETLGAVLALPAEERDDLLRTLGVLLDSCLNVAESARVLHFHYNTMRYRIRKLTRLVGPFTDDSRLRTRLSVALQILDMRGYA
jgi:purine catabolism regulator